MKALLSFILSSKRIPFEFNHKQYHFHFCIFDLRFQIFHYKKCMLVWVWLGLEFANVFHFRKSNSTDFKNAWRFTHGLSFSISIFKFHYFHHRRHLVAYFKLKFVPKIFSISFRTHRKLFEIHDKFNHKKKNEKKNQFYINFSFVRTIKNDN